MKKRADLTMEMVVTIVLLVVGFGIVLFVISQLFDTGDIDKQTCKQSVVLRGSLEAVAGSMGEAGQSFIPLKCKTRKFCVTPSLFGTCEDLKTEAGVTRVRVSKEADIEKAITDITFECWSMMGEGKLSIFSQFWAKTYAVGNVYPSCVICGRIAYDKEAFSKSKIDLSKVDVATYMRTHNIPDTNTRYWEYFGGGATVNVGEEPLKQDDSGKLAQLTSETGTTFEPIDAKAISADTELGILFMQISSPEHWDVLKNDLILATGVLVGVSSIKLTNLIPKGTFIGTKITYAPKIRNALGQFTAGSGKKITSKVLTPFAKFATAAAVIAGIIQQANIAYNRGVTAGYCGDISGGSEARSGCSAVRIVDYNAEDINTYCSVVENIP